MIESKNNVRVLKIKSFYADDIPAEQLVIIQFSDGQKIEALVQTQAWLEKNIEGKKINASLQLGLAQLEKIKEKKKEVASEKNVFYGQIEKVWKEYTDNFALLNTGLAVFSLWLFRQPTYKYPKLRKGDYVKVWGGRVDLSDFEIIK